MTRSKKDSERGMIKKCCRNCYNLIDYPKKNSYNDVQHLCIVTGYFTTGIDKDITKIKRFSPGGKKLKCEWKGGSK